MRFAYRHELKKQTLLASDYAETSMSFRGGNGNGEGIENNRMLQFEEKLQQGYVWEEADYQIRNV